MCWPAPVLAAALPHSNLVARRATALRPDVERMLRAMGGRMPGDAFSL